MTKYTLVYWLHYTATASFGLALGVILGFALTQAPRILSGETYGHDLGGKTPANDTRNVGLHPILSK